MSESILSLAKKALPLRLKRALEPFLLAYRKRAYRKYLTAAPFTPPRKGVWLNCGNVLSREPGAIVGGGRVKLLALDELYPERSDSFNILYLISSALPPFAEELTEWAVSNGVKIVFNQNGVAYPAWADEYLQEKINGPMRSIIHMADYVFYQSKFCLECADKYLGPVDAPWEIAYNYVDTGVFVPVDTPLPTNPWRLLSAGSHVRRYRIISLLDMMAQLKDRGRDVVLTIAGKLAWPDADDPLADLKIEMSIRGLENNIITAPSFNRNEAVSLFQSAHILVHNKFNDPSPNVPIEALACGLPVVGSQSGGLPELVGQGCGILIEVPQSWEQDHPTDPIKMADAIETIMADRDCYSQNARRLAVSVFGKDKWLERHTEVFQQLVSN